MHNWYNKMMFRLNCLIAVGLLCGALCIADRASAEGTPPGALKVLASALKQPKVAEVALPKHNPFYEGQ